MLQDPRMVSILNQIMESSGLEMKFDAVAPQQVEPSASTQPIKELGKKAVEQEAKV